jgi:hypothetical protein
VEDDQRSLTPGPLHYFWMTSRSQRDARETVISIFFLRVQVLRVHGCTEELRVCVVITTVTPGPDEIWSVGSIEPEFSGMPLR